MALLKTSDAREAAAFAQSCIARNEPGAIVLVSSLNATPESAALEVHARQLALELYPHGISVNAVRLPPDPAQAEPLFAWLGSDEGRTCTGRVIDALAWQVDPFGALALRPGLSPLVPARIGTREGLGESPHKPPRRVVRAVQRAAARELRPYPDPRATKLRKALARRLQVPEDNIVFGAGSLELLQRALRTFCARGDQVLAREPTFSLLGPLCAQEGLALTRAPSWDEALAALSAATRLVYWPELPDTARLPWGVPVLIDQPREPATPVRVPLDDRRPVIVLRSFSKAYSLAGVRLGYAVAPDETAGALERRQLPFHISSLAQAAALAALRAKITRP